MSKNKKSQFQRYWSRIDNSPGKLDYASPEQLAEVKQMVKEGFHSGHGMYRERIKELESTVTGHKLAASLLKDHIVELWETLEMVRDADNDCHKDGLQTIPPAARKAIDAALKQRMDR